MLGADIFVFVLFCFNKFHPRYAVGSVLTSTYITSAPQKNVIVQTYVWRSGYGESVSEARMIFWRATIQITNCKLFE